MHFDPEKPENHNVVISSMNNKYIKLHDGQNREAEPWRGWNLRDREETVEDLFADAEDLLETKLESWQEEENPKSEKASRKYQIYLEVKEKAELYKKIKHVIVQQPKPHNRRVDAHSCGRILRQYPHFRKMRKVALSIRPPPKELSPPSRQHISRPHDQQIWMSFVFFFYKNSSSSEITCRSQIGDLLFLKDNTKDVFF